VFPQTGRVLDVATVDLDADGFDDLLVTQDPRGATYYRGGAVGLSATATTTLPL
jgi:FG-GAP repeat